MDPRYKFIRGEPFDGLEDYFKSPTIKINSRNLKYPQADQLSLLNGMADYGIRVRSGYFFELLSQGIYGGKIQNIQDVEEQNLDINHTEPDLTSSTQKCFREVKSASKGNYVRLRNDQIERYALLQEGSGMFSKPLIRFEIFRHGIKELQKNFRDKNLEDLINSLCEEVKFQLSLPFSIVHKLFKENTPFSSKREYLNKFGERLAYTEFSSYGLNHFLAEPEESIRGLGLNLDDFIIQKRKSSKKLFMNGTKIKQYPILLIGDVDHKKWLENFKEMRKETKVIKYEEDSEEDISDLPLFPQS